MTHLGKTIARIAAMKLSPLHTPASAGGAGRLKALSDFGSNPGALAAWTHVPSSLPARAALVVVLHGCTQTAAGYDHGAGWSQLADEQGFALLFPEQTRANNPNLCFNWFSPIDSRRESGEAASIRQMVDAMVARHDIDPERIFVTGLSAGGAMASIMLAAYPDIFAGGAIIAGLPFGAAQSVPDAFARMRGEGYPSDERLAQMVRDASQHRGRWPSVSIWQGTADHTVDPSNARRIAAQWRAVHGVGDDRGTTDSVEGHARESWTDRHGRTVVTSYTIAGMGHGTPLRTGGPHDCGSPGPHMLDAGICSTTHIARSWGLVSDAKRARAVKPQPAAPEAPSAGSGVAKIIDDALRTAGLLR